MHPWLTFSLRFTAVATLLGCGGSPQPALVHRESEVMVGQLTQADIERELPSWRAERERAEVDPSAVAALGRIAEGAEITVFLGTWCSDSRREVPRFWRALEQAPAPVPFTVRHVGVDRDKRSPEGDAERAEIRRVPTFVVRREGREIGRVVEHAPRGIETELLELLRRP